MRSEDVVAFIAAEPLGEIAESIAILLVGGDEVWLGRLAGDERIPDHERLLEQVDDLAWEGPGTSDLAFFQAMRAPQRVTHAQLLQRVLETVVGGGAVAEQGAGVVDANDFLQGVGTAVRVDDITSGLVTDPGVEPDEASIFSPPRFIGSNAFGVL